MVYKLQKIKCPETWSITLLLKRHKNSCRHINLLSA